jgi:hypothetical protein
MPVMMAYPFNGGTPMIDFDWFDDFDWMDLGIAGGLGEEMANEERERRKIEQDDDFDQEDEK